MAPWVLAHPSSLLNGFLSDTEVKPDPFSSLPQRDIKPDQIDERDDETEAESPAADKVSTEVVSPVPGRAKIAEGR